MFGTGLAFFAWLLGLVLWRWKVENMALHKHKGEWYCEAADLGLPETVLKARLYRGRKGQGGIVNIESPFYHGRNSKRLVLLSSLSAELRKQVADRLRAAGVYHEAALHELERAGTQPEEIAAAATEMTAQALLSSQPALIEALQKYLQDSYLQYLEHYLLQGQPHKVAQRYARTCAFAEFVYKQETLIGEQADGRTYSQYFRSLHANILSILAAVDLNLAVPRSDFRYQAWWQQLRNTLREGKSVTDCIKVSHQGIQNNRKLHEEAQQYIKYLYCSGAAPPGRQIYEHLLRHARKMGWWVSRKGFSPPCYRTIALFLEQNQAEWVLGRKGDSAQYAHYLPQIQRSVPTQRNAIWGADGTAHNELVFYNGRTRQYIYGIYVFDYATARLMACEPYNTTLRGESGERAKQHIEALSQAIRATGCCPQVLQIDQGPAFAEVRAWCELREIKVIPAGAKNARAKVVEGLLGRLQNLVVRYRSGWSGQNQGAKGLSAHPSPEQLKEHTKAAATADEVMVWMRAQQLNEYNRKTLPKRIRHSG